MTQKQIEVQIMQQSYMLSCSDGQEERLLSAVRRVDESMTRIRDSGKVRSRDRVAVLAALNMAFDVLDREEQVTQLKQRTAQAETQAQEAAAAVATAEPSAASMDSLAEAQRRGQVARQLVLRLDQALAQDEQLL